MVQPRVDMLPPAQRRLWRVLGGTPGNFVLYGGTALALRLGHRQSMDFDFFSSVQADSTRLLREVLYLDIDALIHRAGISLSDALGRRARCSVRRSIPCSG